MTGTLTSAEKESLAGDLADAHRRVIEAQRQLDRDVAEARQRGLSWSYIGAGLGISKQAAQQRYASVRVGLEDVPLPVDVSVIASSIPDDRADVDVATMPRCSCDRTFTTLRGLTRHRRSAGHPPHTMWEY